jgi:hypothetical protein
MAYPTNLRSQGAHFCDTAFNALYKNTPLKTYAFD